MERDMNVKLALAMLGCTAVLISCQTQTYLALDAGQKSTLSSVPVETIGIGKYSYRFMLNDPRTGEPLRNHAFALSTYKESKFNAKFGPDGKTVYLGVTDRNGQTPTFQLDDKIPDKDFDLRQSHGSGTHSITFRLISDTSGKVLPKEDYVVVVCTDPLQFYTGFSDKNGDTGLVLSDGAAEAIIYAGLRDEEFNYQKDCDEIVAKKA
jgi:hypothetical protein